MTRDPGGELSHSTSPGNPSALGGSENETGGDRIQGDRIADAVRELLIALGEDVARPDLLETPARTAQSWAELVGGRGKDPVAPLVPLSTEESYAGQVVALRDIAFRSVCEHHLLPFDGAVHLMYTSSGPLAGLSSFIRTIDILASRLQLQERLTQQIADAVVSGLAPQGLLVVAVARHGCVSDRGVRDVNARTMTIASRGAYAGTAELTAALQLLLPAGDATPAQPAPVQSAPDQSAPNQPALNQPAPTPSPTSTPPGE